MPLFKTMNIKIDNLGLLNLERNGTFKRQCCPFGRDEDGTMPYCGDWCPHFQPHGAEAIIMRGQIRERVQGLTLCHGTELYGTITDERAKV